MALPSAQTPQYASDAHDSRPGAGVCHRCGAALPRVPRQALADGTPLCKACWRAHNHLGESGYVDTGPAGVGVA
jgi:hypothetical protein